MASTIASLPLHVRKGIRDHFDSADAEVNVTLKGLNGTTGHDMTIEVAWVDLWQDLQDKFKAEAASAFVPTITSALITWIKRLEDLLEGEEFQEKYLTKLQSLRKALFVRVHDRQTFVTTFVRDEQLTLYIPNADAASFRSLASRIGADIEAAFDGKVTTEETTSVANDDFVDIQPVSVQVSKPSVARVSRLPQVSTLARPEVLFPTLLPYNLIVRRNGGGIDVECSHQPTLELIYEYFKRHSRKNMNDSRQIPHFNVELIASFWGTGTGHDLVRMARSDTRATWTNLEITMVLTFVESICGYDLHQIEGHEWIFRRTEPFQQ